MIARHLKGKKLIGDNFQIAGEAKQRKKANPQTIDATIGSLKDEDGKFLFFKTVDKTIRTLPKESVYAYSSLDGGKEFHEAILDWALGDFKEEILNKIHYRIIATSGGTGAVSNALTANTNKDETIILPHIYWGPYASMASVNQLDIAEYKMLDDGKFNIQGLSEVIDKVGKNQKSITIILNDPCNNPTGYSLSNNELKSVVETLNQRSDIKFNLIYDIAYFDYEISDNNNREKFSILAKIKENTIVSIALSCSKTFSIYGLRTGAQIIIGKNKDDVDENYDISKLLSRTLWSNVTRSGIETFTTIMNNQSLLKSFKAELTLANEMLKERVKIFLREADQYQLDYFPYHGGFFITVNFENSDLLVEELKKEDIFIIPLTNAIRISISSITINETKGLARKIKLAMDRCKKELT